MAATTTTIDAALKAAVQEKKVLPKRSTRGQNGSTAADESLISNASSQDYETTECYFLWGCELTRKSDSYVLPLPKTTDLSLEPEEHLLTIKSATLGVDAVEKERNVVEISYHDREDKATSSILASLTLGQLDSCRLDLRLTAVSGRDVTLKLIKGSGPVSILGNHVVESVNSLVVDEEYQTEILRPRTTRTRLPAWRRTAMTSAPMKSRISRKIPRRPKKRRRPKRQILTGKRPRRKKRSDVLL